MPERSADPEHLGADQLLDVDRGGEDRFVGVLEAVLDEGAEHRRQGAGEDHRGGDHAGADELDVGDAVDFVDERRAEAEAEGEQVDDRFEQAGEGRPLPVGAEVGDLAAHHAGDRGRFEPPHPPAAASPRSLRLLPGEQDEDVLERGGADDGVVGDGAVRRPARSRRSRSPGRPGAPAARPPRRSARSLGEPLRAARRSRRSRGRRARRSARPGGRG